MATVAPSLIEKPLHESLDSFPLRRGRAVVYARAIEVDPGIWRAAFAESRKDFDYYRLIEETMTSGFIYRYMVLFDREENAIALQPLILVDQDLAATTTPTITRMVQFIRRVWPRLLRNRMLLAGCLVGEDEPGVIPPADLRQVSALLAEALVVFARRQKISLISAKDFPGTRRDELSPLLAADYTRLRGFPPLMLDLSFASFDEYLERLSRVTRKGLRRKLRKTETSSPPITLEVLTDCRDVIDEIYPLYLQVAARAPVEFEIFSRDYFIEAGKRMPDRHRYFVWRRGGKAIAFSFCTIWKDSLYDNDIGLDYSVAHELNLYYVTFHDLIVWALQHGLKEYHCAPFNYDPKLHLRLKPIDVDLYVRHRSTIINALVKWFAPWFAPAKSDPALRGYYGRDIESPWKSFLKMIGNPWLQIALNAIIVTISELLLKVGARNTAHLAHRFGWTGFTGLASVWTWLGIVFVVLSLISWLYVLRHIPLSIAFPLSNVVHVLVPLSCWIFLGELISPRRWLGIVLVLIGLLIVAKPFARIEEKL
jgi:multidrug transporter EmrE-like cation transporter